MVIYLRAELGYKPDKAALVVRRGRVVALFILKNGGWKNVET